MNQNEQEFLVQKIRTQYTEQKYTELDELKKLDKQVKIPANIFAYVFGSVSTLIMGAGMSLIMTDISEVIGLAKPMIPGVLIGILGISMAILTYPIYKVILKQRREKCAEEIIALSDIILKKN